MTIKEQFFSCYFSPFYLPILYLLLDFLYIVDFLL